MATKALKDLGRLQEQIHSRVQAMGQFLTQLDETKSTQRVVRRAAKGVVMKVSASTGDCRCHDLGTGERFKY